MKKEEFMTYVYPIAELVDKKDADYNNGFPLAQYFPFGGVSYIQMIWTKMLRLFSLVKDPREANFESIEDTIDDMIAYLVFFKASLPKDKTTNIHS
jgi:hypothetical protein